MSKRKEPSTYEKQHLVYIKQTTHEFGFYMLCTQNELKTVLKILSDGCKFVPTHENQYIAETHEFVDLTEKYEHKPKKQKTEDEQSVSGDPQYYSIILRTPKQENGLHAKKYYCFGSYWQVLLYVDDLLKENPSYSKCFEQTLDLRTRKDIREFIYQNNQYEGDKFRSRQKFIKGKSYNYKDYYHLGDHYRINDDRNNGYP